MELTDLCKNADKTERVSFCAAMEGLQDGTAFTESAAGKIVRDNGVSRRQEVEGAMKVQNKAIFMGENSRAERNGGLQEESRGTQNGRRSVFAGDLSKNFDPVAQKRQDARKKVMKIVGDALGSDQKLTDELADARTRMEQSRKALGEANAEIKWAEDERAALRETYGVEPDSQQEQDLELLEKEHTARTFGGVTLTDEERERLEQIHQEGLTEYQQRSMELYEGEDYYKKQANEAKAQMKAAGGAASAIKSAMAKSQTMIKAQNTAEDIMDAAGREIMGMLVDEAKDHIDEEMEEKKEAAQEKAEEEKELEEKLEKIKEKKEDQEELAEAIGELTEQTLQLDGVKTDIQEEIKDIVNKMKLLEEDIKGAVVDTTV